MRGRERREEKRREREREREREERERRRERGEEREREREREQALIGVEELMCHYVKCCSFFSLVKRACFYLGFSKRERACYKTEKKALMPLSLNTAELLVLNL